MEAAAAAAAWEASHFPWQRSAEAATQFAPLSARQPEPRQQRAKVTADRRARVARMSLQAPDLRCHVKFNFKFAIVRLFSPVRAVS